MIFSSGAITDIHIAMDMGMATGILTVIEKHIMRMNPTIFLGLVG